MIIFFLKNIDGKYLTLKDCIEQNKKADAEEKAEDTEEREDQRS